MGAVRRFFWSNMVFEKSRINGNIHFLVGRGRKGRAVFSPLVLLRGSEGVEKP
tara:strand:+ start:123 stop:281 length:159 start_codon:yes stop_codon:yes gene_type:complete